MSSNGFSRNLYCWVACILIAVLLFGCGGGEPELVGSWKIDWSRTLEGLPIEGDRAEAARQMEALKGDVEMEFSADRAWVRGVGADEETEYSIVSKEGEPSVLRGNGGDLEFEWLDADTIRLIQDAGDDGARRGLVLTRR